jgi:hypothetical protein
MSVIPFLFIVVVLGIVADMVVKVVKARSGSGALRAQVDDLDAQLQDQAAMLADQALMIHELHERVDFTERLLAQAREKGTLGRGGERDQ